MKMLVRPDLENTVATLLIFTLIIACKPDDSINILFYNREHANQPVDLQTANWSALTVDVTKPLKIICHGWLINGTVTWYSPIIEAYLDLDFNVIALNWSNFSAVLDPGAFRNVPLVTKVFSDVLINSYKRLKFSPHLMHFIGHSVGVHITSCIAKKLQSAVGILVGRITGLDPASFLLNFNSSYIVLEKTDAKFIDVIHTNAGQLGSIQQLGDIDFWVNGGSIQSTTCTKGVIAINTTKLAVCSHNIAPDYYIASITCNGFVSRKCSNYFSFTFGRCGNSKAVMGESVDQTLRGNYFLNTKGEAPYAQESC